MIKKMKQGKNKLHREKQDVKSRKKLYKGGKFWLVMGITTFTGAAGLGLNVSASTTPVNDETSSGFASVTSSTDTREVTLTKHGDQQVSESTVTNKVTNSPQATSNLIVDETVQTSNTAEGEIENASPIKQDQISKPSQTEKKAKITALGSDTPESQLNQAKDIANAEYQETGTPQTITVVAPAAEIATGVDGTANWDIDQDGNLRIHAGTLSNQKTWLNNASDIQSINTDSGVIASDNSNDNNSDTNHLFGDLPNVKMINLTGLDTSQMTNMTHLFASDPNLESIVFDPTTFDTSNVTDFSRMFWGDSKLTGLDVSHFNTSNGTIFYGMFEGASSLTSIDVSHFDTSKATNMQQMFTDTWALKQIDVSKFDTSHVTNLNSMFERAGRDAAVTPTEPLVLDVSNWQVDNVTDFWGMFDQSTIQKLDVSKWNMGKATNTSNWLNQMPNLWRLKLGPNVKLTDSGLGEVPKDGTELPDQSKDELGHTNTTVNAFSLNDVNTGWQAVADGDEHNPAGTAYPASTLINMYPGDGTGNATEYVWSQAVTNYLRFIDVNTGQVVPGAEYYDYSYTFPAETHLNTKVTAVTLPKGYHFAEVNELKPGQVQPADSTLIGPDGTVIPMYVAPTIPSMDESKQSATLTINYINQDGDLLQQSVKKTGTQGDKLEITAPDFTGYKLVDSNQATTQVILQPTAMTLTLTYEPNTGQVTDESELPTTLNVKYVDENGNPLRAMDTQTGKQSTQVEVVAPVITGYELADGNQVKNLIALQGNLMVLTLTYKHTAAGNPGIPGQPGTPIDVTKTPTPIPSNTQTPTPETNETPGTPVDIIAVPEGDTTSSTPGQGERVQPKNSASQSTESNKNQSQAQAGKAIKNNAPAKTGATITTIQTVQKQTLPQTDESASGGILSLFGISLLGLLGLEVKRRKQN